MKEGRIKGKKKVGMKEGWKIGKKKSKERKKTPKNKKVIVRSRKFVGSL